MIFDLAPGASGAGGTPCNADSDVVTVLAEVSTIFADLRRGRTVAGDERPNIDPGPTPDNPITVTRYRVRFIRAERPNTRASTCHTGSTDVTANRPSGRLALTAF